MKESFIRIVFMVKGTINGRMEGNIREIGNIIKCMEKECLNERMERYLKGNTLMIKKMDLAVLLGQMEGNLLEIGRVNILFINFNYFKMENNMGKEFI